ncbi:MAG: nodulation protein U [Roseovarius sp.]
MRSFLAFKPGHDGAVAHVLDGRLDFAIEAEKDSFLRHDWLGPAHFADTLARLEAPPDAICVSGWSKGFNEFRWRLGAGYFGADETGIVTRPTTVFGRPARYFSSSHERSHIWSAYALSPFAQGEPVYCLVWEGVIGRFYEVDADLRVTAFPTVLDSPGYRYAFVYALADPEFPADARYPRLNDAGKLMALAAFDDGAPLAAEDQELIEEILTAPDVGESLRKARFRGRRHYDVGVRDPAFTRFAHAFQRALFARFHDFARALLIPGRPLLIAGGCGLNCDWNAAWRDCGLFRDVFVPPCANDTGSALGTAVDAMRHFTGQAKLQWDVYAGQDFEDDLPRAGDAGDVEIAPFDPARVARLLAEGRIIAHAAGRAEMGPRALGNRSILASPLRPESLDRLNTIKRRESYRPIAPIVAEDYAPRVFSPGRPSPFMLYFDRVTSDALPAVTHVDGSARIQTVSAAQNPRMHALLRAFQAETGHAVLCNTSLNFPGRGFINRTSDLMDYARTSGLDGFVAADRLWLLGRAPGG